MDGSIRALAMGAAFSLVAAGFAYAVPRAILTTAEQVIVEEAPIEVTHPIVDDTEEIEVEPIGESGKNKKPGKQGRGGGDDGKTNHGAAVSTAARCRLQGRSQGELSSTTAKNKDATVEDAQDACAQAQTDQAAPPAPGPSEGGKSGSHAPAPKEQAEPKEQAQPKERSTSGSTDGGSDDSVEDSGGHAKDDHPGASSKARGQGLDR